MLARLVTVVAMLKLFTFIRCVYAMIAGTSKTVPRNLDDMHNIMMVIIIIVITTWSMISYCTKHYPCISNVVCLPRKDYSIGINAGAIWEIVVDVYVSDPCTYKINVVKEWCRFTQAGSPRWSVERRGRVVLVHKTNDTNKCAVNDP